LANVLNKIVEDKKAEIAQRKLDMPLESFKSTLTPSKKRFYAALAAPNASFILECKKASPSKGLIRENFDLDEIIEAYSKQAACISVLTDEKYFQGKFEYLQYITSRVDQPVINKDFFVDPYQVYLARYYNADAVLLMLSVLSDDEYQHLASLSESLSMDVLTEVSNQEEVERALRLKANIIGINNRDLRDLSTDLATTERLVPLIRASNFDGVIISESGIYSHDEIKRLSPLVDGFLVGSALMAQTNLELAIAKLIFGEVKVCGVTSAEQAKMISQFPVSYMGLIFAEKSPRFISMTDALAIRQSVNKPLVGVFVDAPHDLIVESARKLELFAVQLHGSESNDDIERLMAALPAQCEVWKAVGVSCAEDVNGAKVRFPSAQRLLLDTQVGEHSGGTGQAFDWRWLQDLPDKQHYVIAGGITSDNVVRARQTKINTLDLNSGVESAKGIKSKDKLEQVFSALREF